MPSCNTPRRQRGGSGTALPILNLSPRRVWVANAMPWPLYPQETEQVPILKEAGWTLGPVWTGTSNLTPNSPAGMWTQWCPTCGISLHWLHYPGPPICNQHVCSQAWQHTKSYRNGDAFLLLHPTDLHNTWWGVFSPSCTVYIQRTGE